jgi:hypothetical protein
MNTAKCCAYVMLFANEGNLEDENGGDKDVSICGETII